MTTRKALLPKAGSSRPMKAGETPARLNSTEVPALERHIEVDLAIKSHAKRLHLGAFEMLELIREAIDSKFYERFHFADAAPYIESRTGLAYRSVMRQLQILDGLRALPPGDLEEAKGVLAELGGHRAAILAPALEKEPAEWREWAALARQGSEEALQEAVSSALGLKGRGKAGAPGERLLAYLLTQVPPERATQVSWVFREMGKLGDPQNPMNPVAVLLQLVDLGEQDLGAAGIVREGRA